jgi:hypothetical protein
MGIVGLPNVGKSSLFNLLTAQVDQLGRSSIERGGGRITGLGKAAGGLDTWYMDAPLASC